MFVRVLTCAALLPTANAAAAEPKQPTGKWVVEYADRLCVLSRSYGSEAEPLMLAFNQGPMEERLELVVITKRDQLTQSGGRAKVQFGDKQVDAYYGAASLASNSLRRVRIQIEDDSYKSATQSKLISVDAPDEIRETFSVPGFADALSVLKDCTVDLGLDWGFSIEEQKHLAKPAIGVSRLEGIFSGNDYPFDAVRRNASGDVKARMIVDSSGKPTDCAVLRSSGHEALDKRTCEILMRRARFHPAQNIDGKATRGIYVTTITWRLIP
jgi:TonB family protein